jgi:hypothetical protein
LLKGKLAICRLENSAPVPDWLLEGEFFTVSRTFDELSFVCPQESVPDGIQCNKNWRCLKVEGPLSFQETGVLAAMTAPLAKAKISVFVFSTYDTDYIMVKEADMEKTIRILSAEGHGVRR